ncbi:MAG: NusG domain II-containing protein [Clostridia bacterium]|nr:NusG domain II-containing protein [Clostridia bacterium]MBO4884676.1 NusG domain II-containing protein [Clostridia bacterium]
MKRHLKNDERGKVNGALPRRPLNSPLIRSNRFWVVILAAAFALCAGAALLVWRAPGERTLARITVDGEVVREIDLSAVTGEASFVIETDRGSNTVAVRPGGIRVAEADCPDHVCVKQGWLEGGAVPIVCLPHRLVITLVSGGDDGALDAVSG